MDATQFQPNSGLVFAKAYILAGFLGYAKNHELSAHSVILILQNILAILDPLVLSIHFWFTFGFADCISVSVSIRPKLKNGVSVDH